MISLAAAVESMLALHLSLAAHGLEVPLPAVNANREALLQREALPGVEPRP